MRHSLPLTLAAAVALGVPLAQAHASDDLLAGLKWKTRPVFVLSDSRDDPRVAAQISALDHSRRALDDRNIKVVREARPGSALRKRLGVAERGFAVVLVGKDGSVKDVWHDPVDPKRLFNLIDQMPMRRAEMRG